jgi:diadenylate cyclase
VLIQAHFSSRLLHAIFFPKSPLHDGAVVIQGDHIVAAGCLLPISSEVQVEKGLGTRHRSSLAITRDTDAVVLIVSEERGQVSLAENNHLHKNLDRAELTDRLTSLL